MARAPTAPLASKSSNMRSTKRLRFSPSAFWNSDLSMSPAASEVGVGEGEEGRLGAGHARPQQHSSVWRAAE